MSIAAHAPILVATDLTESSDEALRQGHALATRLGARLVVCHVVPDVSEVRVLFPQDTGPNRQVLADLDARARGALSSQVEGVLARRLDDADLVIEPGSPHAGIHAVASRIGAAVVALGPGATATRVAHHARWAVLVARLSPAGGAVLGATDFSDPALPAIETAAHEATRRGVPLRLLHAVDISLSALFAMPGPVMVAESSVDMVAALVESARARLDESLRRFGATGDTIVAQGPPAPAITEAAATLAAALVVVGTRGRSGLPRLLLGSVAEAVMRDAPCSVLAVPLDSAAEVP